MNNNQPLIDAIYIMFLIITELPEIFSFENDSVLFYTENAPQNNKLYISPQKLMEYIQFFLKYNEMPYQSTGIIFLLKKHIREDCYTAKYANKRKILVFEDLKFQIKEIKGQQMVRDIRDRYISLTKDEIEAAFEKYCSKKTMEPTPEPEPEIVQRITIPVILPEIIF